MRKILVIMYVLTIGLFASALAIDYGYLNVVSGLKDAEIFIDGELIAKDYVNKHALYVGDHYIRIVYNGKLMYSKMVHILADQFQTITSEHFVDIKTDVANRGAIDREAARLRETKGAIGIGFMYGYNFPASGLSVKWMVLEPIGVQASAIGGITVGDVTYQQIGARMIYTLPDKIIGNSTLTGYLAPGLCFSQETNIVVPANSFTATNIGLNLGLEWAPFDPFYFTGEVGTVYQRRDNGISAILMSLAIGGHVFF